MDDADFKGAIPALIDGTASFFDCTFRNSAGVFTGARSPFPHVLGARDSSTSVRLESCLFASNPTKHALLQLNSSSTIYTDDASLMVWDSAANVSVEPQPLSSIPSRPLFLEADDQWFREQQQVCTCAELLPCLHCSPNSRGKVTVNVVLCRGSWPFISVVDPGE